MNLFTRAVGGFALSCVLSGLMLFLLTGCASVAPDDVEVRACRQRGVAPVGR